MPTTITITGVWHEGATPAAGVSRKQRGPILWASGEDVLVRVPVVNEAGADVDLSTAEVTLTIRDKADRIVSQPRLGVLGVGDNSTALITVPDADTRDLAPTDYTYDVWMHDGGADQQIVQRSTLRLLPRNFLLVGDAAPAVSPYSRAFLLPETYTVPSASIVGSAVYITGNTSAAFASNDAVPQRQADAVVVEKLTATTARIARIAVVVNASWSFTAGQILYLGINGALSATAPSTGLVQQMGVALAPTVVMFDRDDEAGSGAGSVPADTILHLYLSPSGSDSNAGTSSGAPFATIGRVNQELASYPVIAALVLHFTGSGTFDWDETLNAHGCGRVLLVANTWTTLDTLTVASGSTALHVRTTAAPGVSSDDAIARVVDGDAAGNYRLVQGWRTRVPVRLCAAGNTALTGSATIDGVTTNDGDRVLLPAQTTGSENGIWVVSHSGAWSRALDADSTNELESARVAVTAGSTNSGKTFYQLATAITPGTTAQEWSETAACLELSAPLAAAPSASDTVELVQASVAIDATNVLATPGLMAISTTGSVWAAGIRVTVGPFYCGCKDMAKWGAVGDISGVTRDGYANVEEISGLPTLDFAAFSESWIADLYTLYGLGSVRSTVPYRAFGIYHCITIDATYDDDTSIYLTGGVIRGDSGLAVVGRYGTIFIETTDACIPVYGEVYMRGGTFRTNALHPTNGLVFCGTITTALLHVEFPSVCNLAGKHEGYTTYYALDAELGGVIGLSLGSYPTGLRGVLGDCHIASLTLPHSVFSTSQHGIADTRGTRATMGRIFSTAGTSTSTPVTSPIRQVSGSANLLEGDNAVTVDNSAATATLQLPTPVLGIDFDIIPLATTENYGIDLVRAASEQINGVAATMALSGSPYAAIRVRCDGTNWIVTGSGILTQ